MPVLALADELKGGVRKRAASGGRDDEDLGAREEVEGSVEEHAHAHLLLAEVGVEVVLVLLGGIVEAEDLRTEG